MFIILTINNIEYVIGAIIKGNYISYRSSDNVTELIRIQLNEESKILINIYFIYLIRSKILHMFVLFMK